MEQLRQDTSDWAPASVEEKGAEAAAPAWGPVKKLLFRFAFVYLVLYSFPFPLDMIPDWGEVLEQPYKDLWNALVPWVGKQVFGVEVLFRPLGSGDTTYNYVQIFCFLVIALTAAAVWSVLDRRRANYARLYEWLRVYVRFVLATAMVTYGAYKLIPSQMIGPWPSKLLQPIGEMSPMGLLWLFIGTSATYTMFTGAAEMLGGLLLVARRTTLLGALVSIGVMGNVVMINFSYDVPVKLFSTHLLLMAVFLAAHDLKRLANLLVLNRRVPAFDHRPLFASRRSNLAALVLRTAFVLLVACTMLTRSYEDAVRDGDWAPRPRMYGIWEVEEFAVDGAVRPLLITDKTLWRRLIFEWGTIAIQYPHETGVTYYDLKLDPGPHMFALTGFGEDKSWKAAISYKLVDPEVLALEGVVNGKPIRGRFRRMDKSRFLILSRGFHWINEWPLNR